MEFLGVPLFDDDIFKLLLRFCINALFVTLLICLAYYPHQKKKSYVFAYFMMNVMVFFICFTLKKIDLGLGMALGLFAVFAILRYRTDAIKIKEMTYLFIVVGIAVINALPNKNTSYFEPIFANCMIVFLAILLERICYTPLMSQRSLTYDNLDLLRPENHHALVDDLRDRTGLAIRKITVKRIDLQKNAASITVYYDK